MRIWVHTIKNDAQKITNKTERRNPKKELQLQYREKLYVLGGSLYPFSQYNASEEAERERCHSYLANEANVAASTQNQALSAIIFLYKNILEIPLERLKNFKRARKPKHLPVVLSEKEALTIIDHIEGVENLIIGYFMDLV